MVSDILDLHRKVFRVFERIAYNVCVYSIYVCMSVFSQLVKVTSYEHKYFVLGFVLCIKKRLLLLLDIVVVHVRVSDCLDI